VELLKSGNIVLRFLLELCVLAALAFWGATTSLRLPARIASAIVLPLIVAAVWALVVSPGARIDLGPLRLVVELVIFAAGVAALLVRNGSCWVFSLPSCTSSTRSAMTVWDQ
jgi:hypothetical protein